MAAVSPAPDLPARLAPITVTEASGERLRLGDLWAERTVVLVHLRHFGWVFCRDHVAQLRDHEPEITAGNAGLAAVGTGDVGAARHFKQTQGIRFPLLVDDGHETYRIVAARTGRSRQLVKARTVTDSLRAMARGRFQGKVGDKPMLLGATHVIRPDGTVPLAWVNDDFTDDAPVPEVIAALHA